MRVLLAVLVWLGTGHEFCADATNERPRGWAQPVSMAGVPNLHRVSEQLLRSAQPSALGMANLQRTGVKTVVNLRSFNSDRREMRGTSLRYEHIYMKAWHPEHKEIIRFLKVVTDPKRTPVLVHCQHGADRTGTMCAVYRVVVQGWSKEDALREMTDGGFGFHEVWSNLPAWIQKLDVDATRREIGLARESRKSSLRTGIATGLLHSDFFLTF